MNRPAGRCLFSRAHFAWHVAVAALLGSGLPAGAQDRLPFMPGYAHYERMRRARTNTVQLGEVSGTWLEGGKAFEFRREAKRYRYDIDSAALTDVSSNAPARSGSTTTPTTGSTNRPASRPPPPERRASTSYNFTCSNFP